VILNDEKKSTDASGFTWISSPIADGYINIQIRPITGIDISIDQVVLAPDESINPDIYLQYYSMDLPWNTTYSAKDILLKPADGGVVNIQGDVKYSDGGMRLVLLNEADIPGAWVLDGGTETSFTDVDFGAAVTLPANVRALILKYELRWTGDGALDYSVYDLRKNGSTETDVDRLKRIGDWYTDLPNGVSRRIYGQVTVGCDSDGVIEYMNAGTPSGGLYLNIEGYCV
jgi:hypothetical protein